MVFASFSNLRKKEVFHDEHQFRPSTSKKLQLSIAPRERTNFSWHCLMQLVLGLASGGESVEALSGRAWNMAFNWTRALEVVHVLQSGVGWLSCWLLDTQAGWINSTIYIYIFYWYCFTVLIVAKWPSDADTRYDLHCSLVVDKQ